MVKLDYCSDLIWKLNYPTHHSITVDIDNSIWAPSGYDVKSTSSEYIIGEKNKILKKEKERQLFSATNYNDTILHISPSGKVISEFSVLKSIYDSNLESSLYLSSLLRPYDPTHINDIEIVNKKLSKKIKSANIGDLLISIRQMNMLAILDRRTGELKWYYIGPWLFQHDPDITKNGNISVFNNSRPSINTNRPKGSSIINYNPENNKFTISSPKKSNITFYTEFMGSRQLLPNDNILVSESERGRVMELTKQGELAWEYISNYNDEYASLISYSQRIDKGYIDINRQCENNQSK